MLKEYMQISLVNTLELCVDGMYVNMIGLLR